MAEYDWTRFTLRINIDANPEALYKAWVTRRNIESWFLRLGEYSRNNVLLDPDEQVQRGDRYKWQWFGYPDSVVEYGEVLQANGKDFFEFTFGGTAGMPMQVSVAFRKEESETIVELTQYNIAVDDRSKSNFHVGCMQGWTFYLANLKSLMEGGIDLRNRNEKLKRMMNS
jgi:uncharacterized protein YndB with AHSA1/START domain